MKTFIQNRKKGKKIAQFNLMFSRNIQYEHRKKCSQSTNVDDKKKTKRK